MPVLSRRTSILAPVSRITWSAAALLIATSCKPDAPTQTPTPVTEPVSTQEPDPLRDLDADIAETMDLLEVPGLAIAIIKDDQVVLAKGYGIREHGKDDRVDADTVFAIASNTKAFVATTVGLLAADGQLDWDDRVTEHLPELKLWDEYTTSHIRVRDLLSHRSGLSTWAGDLAWIGSKIQTDEIVARLQFVPAEHDFRERYGYTNLMYVLAGQVIEAKTGRPWHAVVKERLLDPLGMKRTVVTVDALPQMENVATPHMGRGEKRTVIPYLDVDNAGAAGALNSSVADMAQWLRMQLGDGTLGEQSIVPETVIAATREPHTIVPHKGPAQPP